MEVGYSTHLMSARFILVSLACHGMGRIEMCSVVWKCS